MFGGHRIYAKVFYAKLDTSGPTRLNRPIMLSAPQSEEILGDVTTSKTIIGNLVSGRTAGPNRVEESPALTSMPDAFSAAAQSRQPISACAAGAIRAA